MRTSHKAVESAFKLFVETLGGRVATAYNDVGAYRLDYNGVYGGYNIEKVCTETGGVSNPFGSTRKPAREMFDALHFGRYALEAIKEKVA